MTAISTNQASCRERFSVVKTLERDRYTLCEKLFLFPFCCSYQMHCYLAGCFSLISGKHCLNVGHGSWRNVPVPEGRGNVAMALLCRQR